ncbi:HAD-IIIC family phosphatase [Actinoplanes sp. NPDC048988]|uniref:HAD-IIIC family phosphatase n=1 Tax=Actinoplanes sp. NPDC048988 TaxID=3363901 RepID=UPI0037247A32
MEPVTVKCLVWDLDNTVWEGTLLEGDEPRLRPGVRETVEELDARGILHSVASRNDHEMAWAQLEKLGLADYFVLPRIGFGRKSDAVREIAAELSFALGAMAFVDDQPAERAEVAYHLPEVRCYTHEQAAALSGLPEFTPAVVTSDSRRRRAMYQASFRRDAVRAAFDGPDEEFLRSLELRVRIAAGSPGDLDRVEELTRRTSQMNATGVHYSDAALRELLDDPAHEVLVTSIDDRFGPYGAVGVMLVEKHPGAWHLRLLATSCRVVSLGAGAVIINWLTDRAARAGAHLIADFRRTPRNRMMEIAYRFAGFTDDDCACRAAIRPGDDGIERLHLVAARQDPPSTMRLETALR